MSRRLVCLVLLPLLSGGGARAADWPMFGHDPQRTAASPAVLRVQKPVTRWRRFLGGAIAPGGIQGADLDGDGEVELVLSTGGRVVARHDNDALLWASPLIGSGDLVEILDLDGDGGLEVVARGSDRVLILDGRSGRVAWESLGGFGGALLGNLGAVRLADLDGDGAIDLYASAGFCGGGGNQEQRGGAAWSFRRGGSLAQPRKLWESRTGEPDLRCGFYDVLADLDGDGGPEIVGFGAGRLEVFAGRTGRRRFWSDDLGPFPAHVPVAHPADLDGDGRDELILFTDNVAAPKINSRRVLAVGWKRGPGGQESFGKLWERGVVDVAADRHAFADSSVGDLDGDGRLEVTTSFFDHRDGKWSLLVYDARTGAERARRLDTGELVGLLAAGGEGRDVVIVTRTATGLGAWAFVGNQIYQRWSYANTVAITVTDSRIARRRTGAGRLLAADLCGDATPELLLYELNADGKPATLAGYQVGQNLGAARCPAAYDVRAAAETFLAVQPLGDGSFAAARSGGFLTTLTAGDGLVPRNLQLAELGVRLRGYYSGAAGRGPIPIAADLGRGLADVVVADSRGFALALDVGAATLVTAATTRWSLPDLAQPSAFDVDGDGRWEVLGWRRGQIQIVDGRSGQSRRSYPAAMTAQQSHNFDLLAADLAGLGRPQVVYQLVDFGTGQTSTRALDLNSGLPFWAKSHDFNSTACGQMSTTLVDLDGDGLLDVVSGACSGLVGLGGRSGQVLPGRLIPGNYLFAALAYDVDRDGRAELLTTGQLAAPRALRREFSPLWENRDLPQPRMPYHFAAMAACPEPRYGGTNDREPRFFILDGATGRVRNGEGGEAGVIAAGGRLFSTLAGAVAAGLRPGRLGNVTAVAGLGGPGSPGFLFGSSDGFLYAVSACTGQLQWSLDLGAPVGQPVVAAVGPGGRDQIVVTAGDGYLYGVDDEVFPAPGEVRDVDPAGPRPHDQVDVLETTDTLFVEWSPVPGAKRYECAVLAASGRVVTEPDLVDCGAGPLAALTGLHLRDGASYQTAVRAVGPAGTSIETFSRGLRVRFPPGFDPNRPAGPQPPLADRCTSCAVGAHVPARPSPLALLALAAALLALCRRR